MRRTGRCSSTSTFAGVTADFEKRVPSEAVRDALAATFDDFVSESIQHLVHEMGVRVLERFEDIEQIEFDAQNRLWDTGARGRRREGVHGCAAPLTASST